MNSPAPGWLPDPTTRHQYRYWDGARWTDDVADGGITSTDPIGQAPPLPTDPTAPVGPYPGAPTDPTQQYPAAGPESPRYGPSYGDSLQPPPGPGRKRPSTGLWAALAVLVVALIGGLVYLLVRDDGDETAGEGTEISDEDSTTTEPDSSGGSGSEDSGSGGSGSEDSSSGGSDTTSPDDDVDRNDFLVEAMAEGMEQSAGGAITHEQALCASEAVIDELGLSKIIEMSESGADPLTDPELASRILEIFDDCGVSAEVLQGIDDG
jgi:Protein of unknown function (DUF2510)